MGLQTRTASMHRVVHRVGEAMRLTTRPAARYALTSVGIPEVLLEAPLASVLPLAAPGVRLACVTIDGGVLSDITSTIEVGTPCVDVGGQLLVSQWVDAHTHIDKCYTASRVSGAHHCLADAVRASAAVRAHWTADDIARRMDFALRTAKAHGTRAMRTHLDWVHPAAPPAWAGACRMRDAIRPWMELQLVSICPLTLFADESHGHQVASTLAAGAGVLGASIHPVPRQRELIERVFRLAREYDLDLDLHVDEHLQNDTGGMESVAAMVAEFGYSGRVQCGHCCALALAEEDRSRGVLESFARTGVSLVSLPQANLQLQDGQPMRTPRLRGLPPLIEARAAGVSVSLASDNVCDAFVPAGDFDPLGALGIASLCAHLDDPAVRWIDSISVNPARAMHLAWDGVLRPGVPADLVLLDGRSSSEVMSRPGRTVLRAGTPERDAPPEFCELDTPG